MSNARELSQIATAIVVDTSKNVSVAEKITVTKDSSISGLTVGKGGGGVGFNTAVGSNALAATATGNRNTGVGAYSLNANTSGASNTGLGISSLLVNTTGNYNVAVGDQSLSANTTGANNTALGTNVLFSNTTASNNTAVGYQAGYNNTTGSENVFVGQTAGYNNTTGTLNTFVGYNSGSQVTTGTKNSILGRYNGNQGGLDIRTASNRIVLSDGDGNPRGVFDNSGNFMVGAVVKEAKGCTLYGTGANGFYFASTGTTGYFVTNVGLGTGAGNICTIYNDTASAGGITVSGSTTAFVTSSDYRLKENVQPMTGALAKVGQLKPVTYTWKADGLNGQGFIAHELQDIVPECVVGEKDALDEKGNIKPQGIDTSYLVATLTAAIQELNAKVEAQALEIAQLKGN